jgi:hypothetical protein
LSKDGGESGNFRVGDGHGMLGVAGLGCGNHLGLLRELQESVRMVSWDASMAGSDIPVITYLI